MSILTDEYAKNAIRRLVEDSGPLTEAEIDKGLQWIESAHLQRKILDMWEAREVDLIVQEGTVIVRITKEEP